MSDRATRQLAEFNRVMKMQYGVFKSIDIRLEAIFNALRRETKYSGGVPQEVDFSDLEPECEPEKMGRDIQEKET